MFMVVASNNNLTVHQRIIMASADVLQCLPALFGEPSEGAVVAMSNSVDSSYAAKLESQLVKQSDLIIDFTSLKTCLDPTSTCDNLQQQQPFDYKGYIYELLDEQPEKLSSLQTLSVRRLTPPSTKSTDDDHDRYSRFCYGLMQLSSLTELDLSGNSIPKEMQVNLQLWNLQNLKKLSLDKTSLTALPPSIGRLRKLEVLSLSKNSLKTLPITLGFCEDLKVLNLQGNRFRHIPAVVLELNSLKELKRLDNPLTERYNMHGPDYVIRHQRSMASSKNKDEKKVYNPRSLQTLCSKSVFTSKLDYWKHACLGPLQCKILDNLAIEMDVCNHCGSVVFVKGIEENVNSMDRMYDYSVAVLLVTFRELSGVPFLICACSKECQEAIAKKFGEKNIELQKQLDLEYEQMTKRAIANSSCTEVDTSMNVPESEVSNFTPRLPYGWGESGRRRRHKKKCTIM